MDLIKFIAFLVVSHWGAMLVFKLTTYHRYFWPALPLLIGYSALVGWALFTLDLHSFFLWQLGLATAWLFVVGKKQTKTAAAVLEAGGGDADAVRFLARSASQTMVYYMVSCIVYVVGFSTSFLYLYNLQFGA